MAVSTGAVLALGAGALIGGVASKKGGTGIGSAIKGKRPTALPNISNDALADLLKNNPNIITPSGRQLYDIESNTITLEESPFQQEQRERQEALAKSLSSQLQGIKLPGTDPSARFEQGRQLLEPAFTEQKEQLEQSLADRGIPAGSEAYARELDRLQQSQGKQLQQLSFESVQTAEAQRSARFNELASLLGQAQVGGVGFGQFQPKFQGADILGASVAQQNFQLQQRALDDQRRQALIGGLGQLGSAGIMAFSDERLKEDIVKIGESESGINVYKFNYKGNPKVYQGVIAQEVQESNPEAVIEKDGFLAVNYDLIDVEFKKYGNK